MSGRPAAAGLLDPLCPMHAVLDAQGRVVHAGPTLRRILAPQSPLGQRFLDLFTISRPHVTPDHGTLRDLAGQRLHLQLRDGAGPATGRAGFKGIVVPLGPDGALGPAGGAVINLAFSLAVARAVGDFGLTSADFAATDLTIEMLYLIEANAAATEASRRLTRKLQGARIAAEEQAFTDTLTGLKNRRAMDHVLERLVRRGADFALLTLDLDLFKAVNDSLGHAAGDRVLQEAAARMVGALREDDCVVRSGGDEFVLILPGLRDGARLLRLARRLIARLEEPIVHEGETCRISASVGAVLGAAPLAVADPARLQQQADAALYAAKAQGRGRAVLFDPARHGDPQ